MTTSRPSIPAERLEMPWWSTPVLTIGGLLFFVWFLSTGVNEVVLAALLIALGVLGVLLRPNVAIIATFVYLAIMGDIRRYVAMSNNALPSEDPLLLVAPIICGLLFLRLAFERRLTPNTPTARVVVTLMVVMTIEMFNPLQGGLMVGMGGAMCYLVPMMWFWIGRSFPTEGVQRTLIRTLIPTICIAASILGLIQVYYGFLGFEQWWIQKSVQGGFSALIVEGRTARPFAFFTSPGEFATYLSMGLVCCAAPILVRRWRWIIMGAPFIAVMELLASVRTTIVMSSLAIMVMWVLVARDWSRMVIRAVILCLVIAPLLFLGLRALHTTDTGRAGTLIDHTRNGFLHPEDSSASGHGNLLVMGIWQGIKNPIGNGLGATTLAGSKLGNGSASFEYDVADMFADLGVLGGVVYVMLVYRVIVLAYKLWIERSSLMSLTLIGILVSQLGYWLLGGQYAVCALLWFMIGNLDRSQISEQSHPSASFMTRNRRRAMVAAE